MSIKHYLSIFFIFWSTLLFAQDVKVTASISKTQVATGEVFEVSYSINGSNVESFDPPNLQGFQVVGGPNQSTSMSSINGVTTTSMSLSYDLVASREGTFYIGAATVTVSGHKYSSNTLTVKVIKGAATPRGQSAQGGGVSGGAGQGNEPETGKAKDISKDLFIRAVADKNHVYLGEQLIVSYRLYTKVALIGNVADKIPDLNGFWSQDVKALSQTAEWRTEVYKGEQYNVADIKQTILFPERSGDLTLDPLSMTFVVRQQSTPRDIMEQMFGGAVKDVKYKIASTPVTIHVKALPEAGKPDGYTGAVGKFSAETSVDKTELKANESMNFRLKITGSGNIKLFNTPVTNFPTDFEKYDPKVSDTTTEKVTGVSGSRIYTYLTIPRHEGTYTLNPIKFSYFNPVTQRYVTLPGKTYQIKVNKGDVTANVTAAYTADKQDVKLLGKDIRYIKTGNPNLHTADDTFYGSVGYYLLLLLGPCLFAGAFAYRRWDEKNNSDLVKVKSRKASKLAAKHLANAQLQLKAKNSTAFYEAISRGMYGYISDKLNIPAANLDRENIVTELKSRSVDDKLAGRITETLDLCEMARFAPVKGISEQEVFDKTRNMIADMEEKV